MPVRVVMSLGLICEAWNDASSDVTGRQHWWWRGQFLRGIKSTWLPDIILHLRLCSGLRAKGLDVCRSAHITALDRQAPALVFIS